MVEDIDHIHDYVNSKQIYNLFIHSYSVMNYDNTAKNIKHMFSTTIIKKRMRLISAYIIVLSLLVIGFG
jgi:hypothetical protein